MARIDEIKKRLIKATPGPWRVEEINYTVIAPTHPGAYREGSASICNAYCTSRLGTDNMSNAQFIAHSPEDMKWLLKRVERLESLLEKAKNRMRTVAAAAQASVEFIDETDWEDTDA